MSHICVTQFFAWASCSRVLRFEAFLMIGSLTAARLRNSIWSRISRQDNKTSCIVLLSYSPRMWFVYFLQETILLLAKLIITHLIIVFIKKSCIIVNYLQVQKWGHDGRCKRTYIKVATLPSNAADLNFTKLTSKVVMYRELKIIWGQFQKDVKESIIN